MEDLNVNISNIKYKHIRCECEEINCEWIKQSN